MGLTLYYMSKHENRITYFYYMNLIRRPFSEEIKRNNGDHCSRPIGNVAYAAGLRGEARERCSRTGTVSRACC